MPRLKAYPTWKLSTKLKKRRKGEPVTFAFTGLVPTFSTEDAILGLKKRAEEALDLMASAGGSTSKKKRGGKKKSPQGAGCG